MIYVCGGMYRSGSTFQFNCMRLVLEAIHGIENVYVCFGWEYNPKNEKPIHLIKVHQYTTDIKPDVVVTSIRPKQDIIDSMWRNLKYHVNNGTAHLLGNAQKPWYYDRNHHQFELWNEKAVYCQKFEEISDLNKLIENYNVICEGGLSKSKLKEIVKELKRLKPPKEGIDNRTLLFVGHITKDYESHG